MTQTSVNSRAAFAPAVPLARGLTAPGVTASWVSPRRPAVMSATDNEATSGTEATTEPTKAPTVPARANRKTSIPKNKPLKTIKSRASWGTNFFPGFPSKGPGSRPDWDLRPNSMRQKTVVGVCSNCEGKGVMTCTICNGNDFIGPDGKVQDCPACGGAHEITCSACYGTGKQIELEGNWWEEGLENGFFS